MRLSDTPLPYFYVVMAAWDQGFVTQTTDNNGRSSCLPSPMVLPFPIWLVFPYPPYHGVSSGVSFPFRSVVAALCRSPALGCKARGSLGPAPSTCCCASVSQSRSQTPQFCPLHHCLLPSPRLCVCKFIPTGRARIYPRFQIYSHLLNRSGHVTCHYTF